MCIQYVQVELYRRNPDFSSKCRYSNTACPTGVSVQSAASPGREFQPTEEICSHTEVAARASQHTVAGATHLLGPHTHI